MTINLDSLQSWLQFILAVAAVVTAVVVPIIRLFRRYDSAIKDVKEALLIFVKIKLDEECEKYMEKGHMTLEESENFARLSKCYFSRLDGNHGMEDKVGHVEQSVEVRPSNQRKEVNA